MKKLAKTAIVLGMFIIGSYILVNSNEPVEGNRASNIEISKQDTIHKAVKVDSLKKVIK
jgi:mannose/fructose/N-acetylgalactosamine-specific phosphotransferase system component IID